MQVFDVSSLSDAGFNQILSFLREGGVISFPTDTAYGLAADASNESAVRKIFEIKGRPETKPIQCKSCFCFGIKSHASSSARLASTRFVSTRLAMPFSIMARPDVESEPMLSLNSCKV